MLIKYYDKTLFKGFISLRRFGYIILSRYYFARSYEGYTILRKARLESSLYSTSEFINIVFY